jgi:putative membrane protein
MLLDYYLYIKAFHVIAVMAWLAAMLYLPRLFVYHTAAKKGSAQSETFKVMESRLLRYIATPSMIITWALGLLLIYANPDILSQGWMHPKLLLVFLLSGFHGACAGWTRKFANDANTKSDKFYRIANEVPTVMMIAIVILAVAKPF